MCEPAHSIVQYPTYDRDEDSPFGGQMDMEQKLKASLGTKVVQWGKRIANWFHFSKLGSGHTESIHLSGRASLILPEHTRYEGLWWERKFIVDGGFHGPLVDKEDAYNSAQQYYNSVCMGNIRMFRRFLETSIRNSDRGSMYVSRFMEDCLNKEGRDKLYQDYKRLFGKAPYLVTTLFNLSSKNKEKALKVVMKYTRKRELYVPDWRDDDRLWLKA